MFHHFKRLFKSLGIYGLGDAATSLLNFLLLPVYTRYLTPAEYGVIALLVVLEAVVKILFRWGVDSAFMRLYYDCSDDRSRQSLTSTIFFFMLVLNGVLVLIASGSAPWLSGWLFGTADQANILRLAFLNIFLISFFFLPYSVLRIREQPKPVVALAFFRSATVLVTRLVLVIGVGLGVLGVVLADLLVSVVFVVVSSKWVLPFLRVTFSKDVLRDALKFGLPKLPHGFAHNAIALSDRYLLSLFVSINQVGVYLIGATFGLALKLLLGAFDYAWAPFYLGVMKEPRAKEIYSSVTTYMFGIEALLVAGVAVASTDLVYLMTTPEYYGAAIVIPWIAVGVLFQGVYQLTSIGLTITKRTRYYPAATGIAAVVNVVSNLLLIPRYGLVGAAWANAVSYADLAGSAMYFSQKHYHIDYEWSRLIRITVVAVVAYAMATALVPETLSPLFSLLLGGCIVVVTYGAGLLLLGVLTPLERRRFREWRDLVGRGDNRDDGDFSLKESVKSNPTGADVSASISDD